MTSIAIGRVPAAVLSILSRVWSQWILVGFRMPMRYAGCLSIPASLSRYRQKYACLPEAEKCRSFDELMISSESDGYFEISNAGIIHYCMKAQMISSV
jgi:hypothetical protein